MPRQARLDYRGALHHLIVRAIEREQIFLGDQDRNDLLDPLDRILTETPPCHAWALLPNHLRLLLQHGRIPLATIMSRLLTGCAVRFDRRRHPFRTLAKAKRPAYETGLPVREMGFLWIVPLDSADKAIGPGHATAVFPLLDSLLERGASMGERVKGEIDLT